MVRGRFSSNGNIVGRYHRHAGPLDSRSEPRRQACGAVLLSVHGPGTVTRDQSLLLASKSFAVLHKFWDVRGCFLE